MDTIRAKQAMEIIDVFKNVRSQVANLDKRSVQVSQQSRKPKTQRDVGAEVNVDKAIELMNRTLETKLGALEFVVQNLEQGSSVRELSKAENRQILTQSFQSTNNTGDLIPLWNSIVRQFKERGVSVETQEIIRQKVLELEPNLEAMIYGISETIEYIFQQPFIGVRPRRPGRPPARRELPGGEPPSAPPPPPPAPEKKKPGRKPKKPVVAEPEPLVPTGVTPAEAEEIAPAPPRRVVVEESESELEGQGYGRIVGGAGGEPEGDPEFLHQNALVILDYLRTLSFYKTLKLQVDSGKLELFTQELLSSAFNNVFDTLSAERIELLKKVVPRGVLGKSSIRLIPADLSDFNARLDAIGEELGVRFPPETYEKLRKLPRGEVDRAMSAFRDKALVNQADEQKVINNIMDSYEKKVEELTKLRQRMASFEATYGELSNEIQGLEYEGREALEFSELFPEHEMPPIPEYPNVIEYDLTEDYLQAVEAWTDWMRRWMPVYLENQQIRQHNEFVQSVRGMTYDQKREEAEQLTRERDELEAEIQQLAMEEQKLDEESAPLLQEAEDRLRRLKSDDALKPSVLKAAQDALQGIQSMKEQPISAIRPIGEGKGKAIETRGLASLRKNYGFDSESESDSESSDGGDVLDYDDRRNDMYVTRPYHKK